MDLSIEAIEQDLNRAEAAMGRPEAAIHSQRALIRATLRAQQPDPVEVLPIIGSDVVDPRIFTVPHGEVYIVPTLANDPDRVVVAANILGLEASELSEMLNPIAGTTTPAGVSIQVDEDDETEDVFADARGARKK